MESPSAPRYLPSGDTALTVEFGTVISPLANRQVLALDRALRDNPIEGVCETVPTYRSLLVHYDPVVIGFQTLCDGIAPLIATLPDDAGIALRRWRVPVAYGGASGVDLDDLARSHGLTTAEVIAAHIAGDYRVAMLGFTPGFAYLSGLSESLATPRRPNPRPRTPSGTVSIGSNQTGIQCLAGPSGWHLIGRTPVRTYQPNREPIFLMEPGDAVSFVAIDQVEFEHLDRLAERGEIIAELVTS